MFEDYTNVESTVNYINEATTPNITAYYDPETTKMIVSNSENFKVAVSIATIEEGFMMLAFATVDAETFYTKDLANDVRYPIENHKNVLPKNIAEELICHVL